ncbi:MAG: tetratricopeptide repeat protein [Acidobacteria bacterium]|nr:tetratricopeptide repeat protein [Acidobacteriota bacterium]
MDRQHRRDLKHDKFVDEVGALSIRARENQRLLYLITGAIVALVLIGYGIYFYRSNQEQKAQAALATAIETNDSPLIVAGQTNQNPSAKFKTETERSAAAETQFKTVQSKFSGSDAADVANLYLARIAAAKGDVAGAKKLLQDFIDDHPKHVLANPARYSQYQLRIDNGEAAQVTTELNAELAKTDNQILPGDSMLALLAHAYEVQGSSDKSKATYRQIISQYPDSPYVLDAQRKVGTNA